MASVEKKLFDENFLNVWSHNYQKLEALCKQGKPIDASLDDQLAQWVSIQRRISHMLPNELKVELAALRFSFEEKDFSWITMYRQLAEFVQTHGHSCLPTDQKHEDLKDWLVRQVLGRRYLSEDQFQKLDSLGVYWDMPISRDHRWEQMYWKLKDFYTTFGLSMVPQNWAKDKQLAHWVMMQRKMYAKDKIREDRKLKLSALNFVWSIKDVYESQWELYFQKVASFHKTYGHCRVPCKHKKLVSWIERQRLAKKNKLLSVGREKRLDEIGFIWSCEGIKKRKWDEKYEQLQAYHQQHGHSFVPVSFSENKQLGTWVASQRALEAKGKLGSVKKKKLENLDFVWSRNTQQQLKSAHNTQWESKFEKLKAYMQVHGTFQVSLKIDPALQRWTSLQRKLFYKGKLSQDRIERLHDIRFPWSVQEGYWMQMYDALIDFKKQFGYTRVPFLWKPNPQLAAWVYRVKSNKITLASSQTELLNEIGFDWNLSKRTVLPWEVMYDRLVAFKKEHGHTRVPVKWKEDPKLGKWTSRIRVDKAHLEPERVALLEALGFDWGYKFTPEKAANSN
ncbi:helicase associated domain-containing protein [Pontibacter harenae]|uniref:helicase associated domain-containing protein n=1 Tax=Pontibacter harenae TaxID=2894083 RepID=UPI001E4BFA7C|nr:helicase associated domain-containing protein [Pontibacter harenae]MCC9165806.1 helicase associated domain-containing protein [Pontibacter harenae]